MNLYLKSAAIIGLLAILTACAPKEISVPYLEYRMHIDGAERSGTSKTIHVDETEDLRTTHGDIFTIGLYATVDSMVSYALKAFNYYPINLHDPITAYLTSAVEYALEEAGYDVIDNKNTEVSIAMDIYQLHIDNKITLLSIPFKRASEIEVNVIDNKSGQSIYNRTFYSEVEEKSKMFDTPKTLSKRLAEDLLYDFLDELLLDNDFRKALTT